MSPVTHGLIGWLVAQPALERRDRAWIAAAAVLPDIDGLSLIGGVQMYHRFHHTFGHCLIGGIVVTGLAAVLSSGRERLKIAFLAAVSYHSHLLTDLLGSGEGWGIAYFWPFSDHEIVFAPPFQWELDSWQNVLATLICLALTYWIAIRRGRTFVEFLSPKADARIIMELQKRWK